uniref:Transmembrane protein adipocyte-associated 1 n=1 Tax=Romanomermis culicivorax TaxID=13658 RepID=A0A915J2U4_ROMCU
MHVNFSNESFDQQTIIYTITPLPWDIYANDTNETVPFCKRILLEEIGGRSIRIWDLSIFLPNFLFLLFLIYKFNRIRAKLRSAHTPVFAAFYILVYIISVINTLRSIVSILLSAFDVNGTVPDKILWLCSVFSLFSAELSILSFGLFFGHLDSRTSIRRVLCITTSIGLIFIILQAVLEFVSTDVYTSSKTNRIVIFSHGGVNFWLSISIVVCVVYFIVCLLPYLPIRRHVSLPTKRRFYVYCAFLSGLNFIQAIGVGLISNGHLTGICIVCLTSYIYFAFYAPIVYAAFLRGHTSNPQPALLFSYKLQKDDELPSSTNIDGGGMSRLGAWPINASSPVIPYDEFLYQTPPTSSSTTTTNAVSLSPSPNFMFESTTLNSPVGGAERNSRFPVPKDHSPNATGINSTRRINATPLNPLYNYRRMENRRTDVIDDQRDLAMVDDMVVGQADAVVFGGILKLDDENDDNAKNKV